MTRDRDWFGSFLSAILFITALAIVAFWVTLCLFILASATAHAHDGYQSLRSNNGQLCCGGDPVTGDCEPLDDQDVQIFADGSASFYSHRYKARVQIGREKIVWLPTGVLDEKGQEHPIHWCGVPRSKVYLAPVNDENPDKAFWTYCAFITPGGV